MTAKEKIRYGEKYQCYTADTDADRAREMFFNKYGYDPDVVILEEGIMWVGPVEDNRADN